MRYIPLIYQNPKTWNSLSQEDKAVFMRAACAIVEELSARGEFVDGQGLADVSQARSTLAARWPDAQRWGMEIRALLHDGGEEG